MHFQWDTSKSLFFQNSTADKNSYTTQVRASFSLLHMHACIRLGKKIITFSYYKAWKYNCITIFWELCLVAICQEFSKEL